MDTLSQDCEGPFETNCLIYSPEGDLNSLLAGGDLVKAYSKFVACPYLRAACACFMKRDLAATTRASVARVSLRRSSTLRSLL